MSVQEAADLLGLSPRAVRARLQRGELQGYKTGNRWAVTRDQLPLTAEQHAALLDRADAIREMVEDNLPSSVSGRRSTSRRYLGDLAAFRAGLALLIDLRPDDEDGDRYQVAATRHLEAALAGLGRAWPVFDPANRLRLLDEARAEAGVAAAWLMMGSAQNPSSTQVAVAIEDTVLPPIAGMCRAAERRIPKSRSAQGQT